ncbi:MAG: alpha/beta fold hydrolase [Oligosphaeraceae bacterium]
MLNFTLPFTLDEWRGHRRYRFVVNGCPAWLVEPEHPDASGRWVWCMEFPDAFVERCGAPELLAHGYWYAHVSVGNTFGCPGAQETFRQFHAYVTQVLGLARRVVLVGISRGGLYALRFAAANPGLVSVVYGDAPVCDFKSWPAGRGVGVGSEADWRKLLGDYGFASEAEALAFRGNPVDLAGELHANGVAVVCVVGDADEVVPYEENTAVLEQRLAALGQRVTVFHKPGCGHHPHGLEDAAPVVAFIVAHNGG